MEKIAIARLTKEYAKIRRDPIDGIVVCPNESNLREWHYLLAGSRDSSYRGGVYHGKLVFPKEYPHRPPSIYMITPSGRFDVNRRICMSMSDYHPESWNPSWSIATIILGLQSFMLEDTPSAGCVSGSDQERKRLAFESIDFNRQNSVYRKIFGESEDAMAMTAAGVTYFAGLGQPSQGGDGINSQDMSHGGAELEGLQPVGTKFMHIIVIVLAITMAVSLWVPAMLA